MSGYIYAIKNSISGKTYIGQTWNTVEHRWKQHCKHATEKKPKSMPILHAIAKYGTSSFSVETLEELGICSQKELDDREIFWVITLGTFSPNGYNLRAGRSAGIMSEETRKKIGLINIGRIATADQKKKMSIAHKGLKWSESQKEKVSALMKGRPLPELARKNAVLASIKTYTMISPDGDIVSITNLKKFCEENGLYYKSMSLVCTGLRPSNRGWRLHTNHGYTNR